MRRGYSHLLALILLTIPASIHADMTGMVPGDVVVDNLTEYGPGHAGLYIGRWSMMPRDLQERYAKAFEEAAIRSGCFELLDSYLVIDSMPGRGVRVASMVEQFTDFNGGSNAYYPRLSTFDLAGALRFENDKGLALKWSSLPDKDSRRWKIVEIGLQCALAHVPYDDKHGQLAATNVGEILRRAANGSGLQLDCISLPHFAYWKGAQIDLDTSWWPLHTPSQLYDYAKQNQLWRPVSFMPLLRDTAFLGTWRPVKTNVSTRGMTSLEASAAREELGYFPFDTKFQIRRQSADMTYELQEFHGAERIGDAEKFVLDKMAASPLQTGVGRYARSESGMSMSSELVPTSSEGMTFTTAISSSGKSATVTVYLKRERSARKLAR
ncbi:MAG: hypothetical protein HZC36_03270 [Armatimonadetes bacterium]|nr:hypothetical protein [Armatimonadota bacterium]